MVKSNENSANNLHVLNTEPSVISSNNQINVYTVDSSQDKSEATGDRFIDKLATISN